MIAKLGSVVACMIALAACAHREKTVVTYTRPGAPAYWESEIPREPPGVDPGTRARSWPMLRDEALEGSANGVPGQFVWDEATPLPKPPESQTPLRDRSEENGNGGSGEGGSPR